MTKSSNSITVGQLVKLLQKQPQHYKVYTSSDPEGNSFCSYRLEDMLGGSKEDEVVVLYAIDNLMYDEIAPIDDKKISDEIEKEFKSRETDIQ